MTDSPRKQVHLAAHFPGVNNTTVWSDPRSGSHIEFDSFVRFAQIAERAKFDFLFLAEGLRLREQGGQIYDLDVVGRPDTFTVLAALAAVTDRLGPDRHDQLDVQRAVRRRPAVRHPRPPVRRPRGLERGHLLGRVHRRELPARRIPGAGPAVRAGRELPGRRATSCSTPGPGSRFSPTRAPARSCAADRRRPGSIRHPRQPLRHRGSLQRAARPAGPTGDLPGRRLRRRPGVRRRRPRTRSSAGTAPWTPAGRSTPTSSGRLADLRARPRRAAGPPGRHLRPR